MAKKDLTRETKLKIIEAGQKAVDELIKIAKEPILSGGEFDPEPEKLKNAAATKKLAIMDAFEILNRMELERNMLDEQDKEDSKDKQEKVFRGFAEGRSK